MTDLPFKIPPKIYARIDGGLYLIIIAIGLWGEAFVREKLIVSGDAAATAANIRSMESLWRLAIGAELMLLEVCCDFDADLPCLAAAAEC